MITLLLHAVQVTGVQLLLFVLVPAWALSRIRWLNLAEWMFTALVAGVVSAALLGQVCNGSGIGAGTALGIWLTAWIGAGVWLWRKKKTPSLPRMDWLLGAVLILAWVVRMIHPLQTCALGQSDAYSHLGFLRDVLEQGRVGNGDYPPAYAWVMAFPAWLLQEKPYWVARFGGAFFGVGLVLGTHVLLTQVKGRTAGLAAAVLVAGCPLFWLLQKTGVGSFANQLGLLLIPAVLWAYVSGRRFWLAATLAALAVAVPMMLLHALILLALLIQLTRSEGRRRMVLLAMLALAFVLALGIAFRLPPARGMVIASMLTGNYQLTEVNCPGWGAVMRVLVVDFISLKRIGYGSWMLNGTALAVTALFATMLAFGWRRRDSAWLMIGAWGLLASANLHLGLFQFTNYQREGWSLLIAMACMGGLIFDVLWRWRIGRSWRGVLGTGIALASAAGLLLPPAHNIPAGPAESDVVRFLLTLDPSATVLARNMSGFASGQGDVIRVLHPRTVSEMSGISSARGPVYFLRDYPRTSPQVSPVMRILQPALTEENEKALMRGEEDNRRLEAQLSGCEVRVTKVSPYLDVWQVLSE